MVALLLLVDAANALEAAPAASAPGPIAWADGVWQLQIDDRTGALVRIQNRADPEHMDWLREPGQWQGRDWKPDTSPDALTLDGQWGLVTTTQTGLLHVARVRRISARGWEATYSSAALTVIVRRELEADDTLSETYTFKNTGVVDLDLPVGSAAISAPLFDQYPDAHESLTRRCHVHVWTGGASAWVNALRMGAAGPHLGLVVTQGSLEAYSQHGGTFNDRGVLLLHPGAIHLNREGTATVAWRLFWHQGWNDFFARLAKVPGFVRVSASRYVVAVGEPLEITAESAGPLTSAQVFANGQPVTANVEHGRLVASIPTRQPGDLAVAIDVDGRRSWLRAFVTPPLLALIDARVKFIVRKQQRHAAGDPLDGAYLAYDNDTGQPVYDPARSDHNAGRERVGMGVLGALYLPLCRDQAFQAELRTSLQQYAAFLARELESDEGVVFEAVGRKKSSRIYNFPWVAAFHLALYRATGDEEQLDRFVRVLRAYYAAPKASEFYPIGMPVYDGLKALADAGRTGEREELLRHFRAHADGFAQNGVNYPRSEVNFEQSIVAPAVQFLAEMYLLTGEARYRDAARAQMPVLEAFAGRQPDSRLYEISLRHWDDFWFGKLRVYGDTLPHYWSTINALAYAYYGLAIKDPSWRTRAEAVVDGNLSLFNPDGSASAAHLYALATNGTRGQRNDPWANDQDWALVNSLLVRGIPRP